jgi:hypothetical protein
VAVQPRLEKAHVKAVVLQQIKQKQGLDRQVCSKWWLETAASLSCLTAQP